MEVASGEWVQMLGAGGWEGRATSGAGQKDADGVGRGQHNV